VARRVYLDKKGYYRYSSNDELVHRAVMARHLGRKITSEEIVDHINVVRTDNRIQNLRLVPDRWSHAAASGLTVHGEKLPNWKPRPYKRGGRKKRYGVRDWRESEYHRNGGETADRTNPRLWDRVKATVTRGSKGGKAGQWSARKAQMAVAEYKRLGGGYRGRKSPRNSLARWTSQKWRTRSGRPSLKTGERYLPSKAIRSLSPAEYGATTRAKRRGMRRGRQFVRQPERIARKVRKFRKNGGTAAVVAFAALAASLILVAFYHLGPTT
jgi:hypothetical protein